MEELILQLQNAIKADPTQGEKLATFAIGIPEVQKVIENKAKILSDTNIGEKIKEVHSRYDADGFEILGEKPKVIEGGGLEKSYDFIKRQLIDYKKLKEDAAAVNKDQKVIELEGKVKELTENGGGKHVQAVFDQAKEGWTKEKAELEKQLLEAKTGNTENTVKNEIGIAKAGLKLNPDIDKSISDMALANAEAHLLKNSKVEDGKIIYLDANGKPLVNAKFEPMGASEALETLDYVKVITLKTTPPKSGGEAPITRVGNIEVTKVDGKDGVKRLVLEPGSFTSRSQFVDVAEAALIDAGISRSDKDFATLQDAAYIEYGVKELPAS